MAACFVLVVRELLLEPRALVRREHAGGVVDVRFERRDVARVGGARQLREQREQQPDYPKQRFRQRGDGKARLSHETRARAVQNFTSGAFSAPGAASNVGRTALCRIDAPMLVGNFCTKAL